MKKFYPCASNDPTTKQKGRTKDYKPSAKLVAKTCWPKVMISRSNLIYKKSKDPSETNTLSWRSEQSPSKLEADEDLYWEQNDDSFEEEQGVCLISSSSEIACESLREDGNNLQKLYESNEENGFACGTEESIVTGVSESQERPIFVDLTTDEKSTLLKRFDNVESTDNEGNRHQTSSTSFELESRIMIADSSSKLNCSGGGSLTTALRDRGFCLIPVQPNRSLPIRPVPCVPPIFHRKDSSSILVLSKSSATDVVEVEPMKSIDTMLSKKEVRKEDFDAKAEQQAASKELMNVMDYVVPQISNVESLSGMKRKSGDEPKMERDSSKENRKKRSSQEADSTQKEERVETSIKEFLTNFCGSNSNEDTRSACTDKCSRVVSSSKEEGNKVVPPLRLKKVISTEKEGYTSKNSGAENESNYRIVTGTTPRPSPSPILSNWNNVSYEKGTNFPTLNTDSYKLEHRRNKLKQKLRELHEKALELAKQMASDSTSQQNTRLRQVMNRYEKQIENLSKLHSKLSAAPPTPSEPTDVYHDVANPASNEDECLGNFDETNEMTMKDDSSSSSLEPPKLSPRSPVNYENILPVEIRNSPPILPKVSLTISSSQDSVGEELQIAEKNIWTTNEASSKSSLRIDSVQEVNTTSSDFEECVRTSPSKQHSNTNTDMERSHLDVNQEPSNYPVKVTQLSDGPLHRKKKDESNKLMDGRNSLAFQDSEKIKGLGLSAPGPAINSLIGSVGMTKEIQDNEILESKPGSRLSLPKECVLQANAFASAPESVPVTKIHESTRNESKIALDSNQWTDPNTPGTALNRGHSTNRSQHNYKSEGMPHGDNHLITEQFPTLGNWLARMSKKQAAKSKSKLQSAGNTSFTSAENSTRIAGVELQKIVGPGSNSDSINITPSYNTDIWQYHHQQEQRQQQLLQQLAASVNVPQPTPIVPPLRSALCPPIPMAQFYPSNYTIDPYNSAALSYHSAICPYGTYPYHSRLHSSSLSGYHFPMQESLRPLQHLDKRFPSLQDSVVRYPAPSTSLQHPANIDFERIRESSTVGSDGATTSCLPSLFMSPPSLSSSHQAPRTPLAGYSTNGQLTRNRMMPDVVAAAAAAAVVAAASIDRQRNTLTFNRSDTNPLTPAGIGNAIDSDIAHSSKTNINRDTTNRAREGNFGEETRENTTNYQQMQNLLYDRLTLVKTTDNFAHTNSLIYNDTQAATTTIVSTTPYQVPLTATHSQLSRSVPISEFRNCDTPHLGKINHSPNSLHNLLCSNCGSIGPRFKCLGCEMAFYCDERCQEKHWYVHVQGCPKKMPKLKKVT